MAFDDHPFETRPIPVSKLRPDMMTVQETEAVVSHLRADASFGLSEWIDSGGDPNSRVIFTSADVPSLLTYSPTLLAVCGYFGSLQCFRLLTRRRASLSHTDSRNLPLECFIAAGGSQTVLNAFLRLSALSSQRFRKTALHIACEFGQLEIVKFLIASGVYSVNAVDDAGMTPLHLSVERDHVPVVEFLLTIADVNPNIEDVHGWTVLHSVARKPDCGALLPTLFRFPNLDFNCAATAGWRPFTTPRCWATLSSSAASITASAMRMPLMMTASRRCISRRVSVIRRSFAAYCPFPGSASMSGRRPGKLRCTTPRDARTRRPLTCYSSATTSNPTQSRDSA
jgi:hypothetical protein